MRGINQGWLDWSKRVANLVRLPNLMIIILTQVLLRYCVLQNLQYRICPEGLSPFSDFILLVLATLLIATGGYVINDYYDVRIDEINKPEKRIFEGFITYRGAIKLHLLLNGIAVLIGFFLAYRVRVAGFALIFPFIGGILWLYSAKYKRVIFWGNFIVAVISAAVIMVVWLFDYYFLRISPPLFTLTLPGMSWVSRIFLSYAFFAFMVSIIREIIKDMEDLEGDQSFGCRTFPIVFGLRITRFGVILMVGITILILGYFQWILIHLGQSLLFWYLMGFVQLPCIFLGARLFFAKEKSDFHLLSNVSKVIMLTGILSMFFL